MVCPSCNGTGWRSREVDGVRRVERCDCWREQAARKLFAEAKIPPRYQKCDLGNFVVYPNEELKRAVAKAGAFIEAFPVVDKGLMLIGPPGIGKTHIAVAVLRQVVLGKGIRGLYYDTRSLLSTIRSTYNPVTRTSEIDVLKPVLQAELLVLDDLGAERLTDWVEETMNLIVNTRYSDRRPTIFTSNYENRPEPTDLDALPVRVGVRMHSRLMEMCEFLEWSGPDYRTFDHRPDAESLYQAWKSQPRPRLPLKTSSRARAQLREGRAEGRADLGWSGGKAST